MSKKTRDLTGEKIDALQVLERIEVGKIFDTYRCQCECGEIIERNSKTLLYNEPYCSCGCKRSVDLTGVEVGYLKVLYRTKKRNTKNNTFLWACECVCGEICHRSAGQINTGIKNDVKMSCDCMTKTTVNSAASRANFQGIGDMPKSIYGRYVAGARTREIDFDLTMEDMWELFLEQDKKCKISGYDIDFTRRSNKENKRGSASLDRIDSKKNYTIDNIQWLHKWVNRMKMDFGQDKFLKIIEDIHNHQQKLKWDEYNKEAASLYEDLHELF